MHGAINMLGLAKRLRCRILQASTSEVYGDPVVHPQTEDYWGNVNPIGPRSCYDEGKRCAETLFFDYHRQHGLEIKVARIFNTYGPRMHPNDGRVVSNFMVIDLTGSRSRIIHRRRPQDDPRQRRPDISKANDVLAWAPRTSLSDGLTRTIEYFEELLSDEAIRPQVSRTIRGGVSVTYRLPRGPAGVPADDRVAPTFGAISASRELPSDHAQGKFTAVLDARFHFVGRVPGCPSANTNHRSGLRLR